MQNLFIDIHAFRIHFSKLSKYKFLFNLIYQKIQFDISKFSFLKLMNELKKFFSKNNFVYSKFGYKKLIS